MDTQPNKGKGDGKGKGKDKNKGKDKGKDGGKSGKTKGKSKSPSAAYPRREVCKYWMRSGNCREGDKCPNRHPPSCNGFQTGSCKFGDSCRFAHFKDAKNKSANCCIKISQKSVTQVTQNQAPEAPRGCISGALVGGYRSLSSAKHGENCFKIKAQRENRISYSLSPKGAVKGAFSKIQGEASEVKPEVDYRLSRRCPDGESELRGSKEKAGEVKPKVDCRLSCRCPEGGSEPCEVVPRGCQVKGVSTSVRPGPGAWCIAEDSPELASESLSSGRRVDALAFMPVLARPTGELAKERFQPGPRQAGVA